MKKSAQSIISILTLCLLFTLSLTRAFAIPAGPQQCEIGQTCAVGEFLYDDTYAPISTATCSITSRYPNGTVFINSQPMVASSDGWYSYDIVATTSAGLYRSQVCCTSDGEYMCLDKSYEMIATGSGSLTSSEIGNAVWDATRSDHTTAGTFGEALQNIIPSASDIASAVWGYSGRTLTGFGTLVADIWANSTRSLTTFDSVASSIWEYTTRTLTGSGLSSGSIATKDDLEAVKSDISTIKTNVSSIVSTAATSQALDDTKLSKIDKGAQQNRLLLERLVNKPIIQNFLEEDNAFDLQSKLDQTKIVSSNVTKSTSKVVTKLALVSALWNKASSKEVLLALDELSKVMGNEGSSSKDTMIGSIKQLQTTWDMAIVDDMYQQTIAFKTRFETLRSDVRLYGKTQASLTDVSQLKTHLVSLSSILGTSADAETSKTFYGKIHQITRLSSSFDKDKNVANQLLANWKSYKQPYIRNKAEYLFDNVSILNNIPQAMLSLAIDPKGSETEKQLKNKVLGMKGVIDSNRKLLATGGERGLVNMWLEEGSIVFKSLVTNPSALISQTVPLKYYLPLEVTKESIIKVDDGLKVEYDSEKNQYYVSGEFSLEPEETKTISVTVDEGIFTITQGEIDSLHKQTEELAKPLKNTAFFAQGVTLTSDIDVALDKISQKQQAAVTPEGRIRAYRESQVELSGVKVKIDKLKELVTEVSSSGSLVGFVGGAQVIAVWGLIIIMVTGFVFLVLYMRVLRVQEKPGSKKSLAQKASLVTSLKDDVQKVIPAKSHRRRNGVRWGIAILVCSIVTSVSSGLLVYRAVSGSQPEQARSEKEATIARVLSISDKSEVSDHNDQATGSSKFATIQVTSGEVVELLSDLRSDSSAVYTLYETTEVEVIKSEDGWVKVRLSASDDLMLPIEGWVQKKDIQSDTSDEQGKTNTEQRVSIAQTPVGYLRVRSKPWGQEIAKVSPGETYVVVSEDAGWWQITLQDNSQGWVSKEYAHLFSSDVASAVSRR